MICVLHFIIYFLISHEVRFWEEYVLIRYLMSFPQVNRAQYQNGLLASKLDSTPQSPQSNHIRLDSMLARPSTPPTSSTTCSTAPPALTEGTNETTALLNDRNSLNNHRAAQPQSKSNSNTNLNTNTNSNPHPLSNSHPQSQSYPNNPNTHTPHLPIHTISRSHAHTESTIWQKHMVGARLQRGSYLFTHIHLYVHMTIYTLYAI